MSILIAVATDYAVDRTQLSENRLAKAARLQQSADRARCLCAGVALDLALQTVGLREKAVALEHNRFGKPFLRDYPEWHFSLSHSGEFAVCALSNKPIGVDIEQVHRLDYQKLADRWFTVEEARCLRDLPEREQQASFFRIWTEKESLLKAVGVGLSGLSDAERFRREGYAFRRYPLVGHELTVCTAGEFPAGVTIIK